ncbi:hypothetical protein KY335_04710 [Candidatus Woesearchaeota archaeon]|nr:hypothetical protein [Candidatus Woesearchaeota archaeon]MBW3014509.1 hypothetical protein [Candidatus Woesearchaeota archaeon]
MKKKYRSHKKAQIQTLETIAVLFVFFLLISLSLIFYMSFSKGRESGKMAELSHEQAVQVAQLIAHLPEIRATQQAIRGVNTFDLKQMEALKIVLDQNPELSKGIYQERFGTTTITVREIFPVERNWTVYDNPDPAAKFETPFFIPVALYDPVDIPGGNYSFGMLEVVFYG